MRKIRATYTSEKRADEALTTSVEWIAAEVKRVEAAAPGTRVEVYGTGRETVLAKLQAAVPVTTTAKTASASAMLDVGVDVVNGRDTVATFGAAVHAVPWVAVESDTAMLTRYGGVVLGNGRRHSKGKRRADRPCKDLQAHWAQYPKFHPNNSEKRRYEGGAV
jgi:hypothetical protein